MNKQGVYQNKILINKVYIRTKYSLQFRPQCLIKNFNLRRNNLTMNKNNGMNKFHIVG